MSKTKPNLIKSPTHYNWHPTGIECKIITGYFNFNLGNVIKYVWRAGYKKTTTYVEDLQKAREYIDMEIERYSDFSRGKALYLSQKHQNQKKQQHKP